MRWFLFAFLFLANASIEVGTPPPDYGQEFGEILQNAGRRLEQQAARRPLRLTNMNESLSRMADATRGMAAGGDRDIIWHLLEESRRLYRENSFPLLLQAVLLSGEGKTDEANEYFLNFMTESRSFTGFEETFLRFGEFHRLRRTVYELLRSRGISFSGKEKEIQARIPYKRLMEYMKDSSAPDALMGYGFLAILLGGGVLLLLTGLMGADFSHHGMGYLVVFYIFTWVAYGVWLLDLVYGLPVGLDRFQIMLLMYAGLLVVLAGVEVVRIRHERSQPLEPGFMRCPKCGEVVPKLLVSCPRCRRSL